MMILLLPAVFAVWSGQVATASQIAQEIGKDLGAPIEVASKIKNDLVFAEPHGANPKSVLTALATALHGSIRKEGTGYIVERTKADLVDLRRERTLERTAWIKRRINHVASFRKAALGTGSPDAAYFAAIQRQREQIADFMHAKRTAVDPFYPEQVLPSQALIEGLLARIGFSELAALPSGSVRVFEDEPTASANSLPTHSDLLDSYEKAMQPLRAATTGPVSPTSFQRTGQDPNTASWSVTTPIARLRLAEQANENGMVFQLEGFDSGGRQILSAGFDIGPVDGKQTAQVLIMGLANKPDLQVVTFSPEADAAVKFASGEVRGPLPEWFVHPEKHEPLNLFVREALEGIASRTPAQPVVIAVSDALWSSVRLCTKKGKVNIDGLLATIEQWTPYESLNREGTVIWRPKDCEIDESRHSDRRVLAHFVSDFQSVKHAELRDVARMYRDASSESAPLAGAWAIQAQLSQGLQPILNSSLGEGFYKVIGAIDDVAWHRLVTGETLTAGETGIESELTRFFSNSILLRSEGGSQIPDIEHHPTESIIGGQVGLLQISLHSVDQPIVKMWRATDPETDGGAPYDQFLNNFYVHKEYFQWQGETPTSTVTRKQFEDALSGMRYRNCSQPTTDIAIGLPKGQHVNAHILGNIAPTSEPFTYMEFPQKFRDAAWKNAYDAGLADAQKARTSPPIPVPPPPAGQSKIPPR